MIGFWIFIMVLLICATIVICKIVDKWKVVTDWDYRFYLDRLGRDIADIKKAVKRLEEKEGGVDHE